MEELAIDDPVVLGPAHGGGVANRRGVAIASCISSSRAPLTGDVQAAPALFHQAYLVLYITQEADRYRQTHDFYWGFPADLVLYITPLGPPRLQIAWMILEPLLGVFVSSLKTVRVGLDPPPLTLFLVLFSTPLLRTTLLPIADPPVGIEQPATVGTVLWMMSMHGGGDRRVPTFIPPQKIKRREPNPLLVCQE